MGIRWDLLQDDLREIGELLLGFVITVVGVLFVSVLLGFPLVVANHYVGDLLRSIVYVYGSIGIAVLALIRYTTWFGNSKSEDEEGVSADD